MSVTKMTKYKLEAFCTPAKAILIIRFTTGKARQKLEFTGQFGRIGATYGVELMIGCSLIRVSSIRPSDIISGTHEIRAERRGRAGPVV